MLSWEGKWEKVERENERKYREKWTEKFKKNDSWVSDDKRSSGILSLSLSLFIKKNIYITYIHFIKLMSKLTFRVLRKKSCHKKKYIYILFYNIN